MEIKGLRKINGTGKVKAFFSVSFEKLVINDCKLIEGSKGLFASLPSREYEQNGQRKYSPTVWVEQDLLQKINDAAIEAYMGGNRDQDVPF